MPRGRKKKFKLTRFVKIDSLKSASAIFLLTLSAISLVAFFLPGYSLNGKLFNFWRSLFGITALLFPLLLGYFSLFLLPSLKLKIKNPRVMVGLTMFFLALVSIFHVRYTGEAAEEIAAKGLGGGLVGLRISELLRGSVSVYGAVIVLLALVVISAILTFNFSLDDLFEFMQNKLNLNIKGRFKKEVEESQIVVGDTRGSFDEEPKFAEISQNPDPRKQKDLEPKIEIVPSISEPGVVEVPKADVGSQVVSLANLPYSDKVWENPPIDLLVDIPEEKVDTGDEKERQKAIIDTLKSFGINVRIADTKYGPSITRYALATESGVRIAKISALQHDLAMALASPNGTVRIEAPIPGTTHIGIEVPNTTRGIVNFRPLLTSENMKNMKSKLGIVLGKDVGGSTLVYDVLKMPHLLVAGTTGSGKSVFLHSTIFSMLFKSSPNEVNFILIDPKRTELIHYQDIPHLVTPVITDVEKAPGAFKWAVGEMERRYKMFESARARNIESYNEMSGFQALPYIVIIVDELAEIMIADPASVEKSIIRLAQLSRATGIHLILAVQRPSTNVITGLIKANIPARIAFNVSSQVDSRVIIDQPGAEKLLGKGDMLFIPPDAPKPTRLQGAFVRDDEIKSLVNYLKSQGVKPKYNEEILAYSSGSSESHGGGVGGSDEIDELYEDAASIVADAGKASTSYLQRRLSIGYARAAKIIDQLEEHGVVGPAQGSKPREILKQSPKGFAPDIEDEDIGERYVS